MPQQMMWSLRDAVYRGQASDGTVVTVDDETMQLVLGKAGKGIFESDWWTETLRRVLEHWGVKIESWTDETTHMPRLHFSIAPPGTEPKPEEEQRASGPLSTRLLSKKKDPE